MTCKSWQLENELFFILLFMLKFNFNWIFLLNKKKKKTLSIVANHMCDTVDCPLHVSLCPGVCLCVWWLVSWQEEKKKKRQTRIDKNVERERWKQVVVVESSTFKKKEKERETQIEKNKWNKEEEEEEEEEECERKKKRAETLQTNFFHNIFSRVFFFLL